MCTIFSQEQVLALTPTNKPYSVVSPALHLKTFVPAVESKQVFVPTRQTTKWVVVVVGVSRGEPVP